jgi:hypothetical protein
MFQDNEDIISAEDSPELAGAAGEDNGNSGRWTDEEHARFLEAL